MQRLLHQPQPHMTTRVAILVQHQRRQLTFSATIPTNQGFEGTPVTPTDKYCRIIPLPMAPLDHRPPDPTQWMSFTSVVDQFRQNLAPWQRPLFGPITKCQPTPAMHSICMNQGLISLVSDASVQKTKQSGFAWVITNKTITLWKGVGLAPGNAEDMYSGRAEAFGLLAGLIFLQSYLSYYGDTQHDGARIQCFCDNQGIISNINNMRDTSTQRPNDTTNDDYDVYRTICDTVNLCAPIRVSFWHVKGHQDCNHKRPLTHIEQLNVECDTRAKRYTTTTSRSSTDFANPPLPAARPHLCIGKKIVCRKVLPSLRWAISTPAYRTELQQRHQWSKSDFENINWTSFQAALTAFQSEDQRRLILFINDKLPLRASKAHPHHGSQLCPSCQCESETAQHFLTCRQPDRRELFTELKNTLTKMTQKYQLHPCLFTSLWLGLTSIRSTTPYPDIIEDVEAPLKDPIHTQTRLGWDQFYKGRTAKLWTKAIDTIHPKLPIAGEQIMTTIIKAIWTYFLAVWKTRNTHLHHNASQLDLPNYRQAVETLYEQRHKISPEAQAALYRQPLQEVLEQPATQMQQWVTRGYRYFTQQQKAERKRAILHTPDIRTFFQTTAQHPNDLQPP